MANAVSVITVYQNFEENIEEHRFKEGSQEDTDFRNSKSSFYSMQVLSYGWSRVVLNGEAVYSKREVDPARPFYTACLKSAVNPNQLWYGNGDKPQEYGADFVGPKSDSPRHAVMALLDAMLLAAASLNH